MVGRQHCGSLNAEPLFPQVIIVIWISLASVVAVVSSISSTISSASSCWASPSLSSCLYRKHVNMQNQMAFFQQFMLDDTTVVEYWTALYWEMYYFVVADKNIKNIISPLPFKCLLPSFPIRELLQTSRHTRSIALWKLQWSWVSLFPNHEKTEYNTECL